MVATIQNSQKHNAILLLGGNLGNVTQHFKIAKKAIKNIGSLIKESSLYKTEAWGMENAPDFLNQIIEIETILSPTQLLDNLLDIEKKIGRERNTEATTYQSRTIDIDILFFNKDIIDTEKLTVPHPRIAERRFVLEPLSEKWAAFIHPVYGKSLEILLGELEIGRAHV